MVDRRHMLRRAVGAWPLLAALMALLLSGTATAGTRDSGAPGVPTPGVGTPGLGNDPRFGVVQAFEAPQQASAIGVRWERIMFQWGAIQPTGPSDWRSDAAISDATLSAEIAAGRTPVGILLDTPQWAARDPQYHDAAVPNGLDQPWNSTANPWGAFVHRIVAQYRGRI